MDDKLKENNSIQFAVSKQMLLSASVIFSALLVSGAIFLVGSDLSGKVSGLATAVGGIEISGNTNPSGQTARTAPQESPEQIAPSPGAPEMKALLEGAAATVGNQNAEIIIVEYSDYQCPFCRTWFSSSKGQLQSEYIDKGNVLFVYKDFPLSFHPMAQPYAEAARCAGDQGKYWEMHDKIFEEQNKYGQGTISNLTKDDIKAWATELGLNAAEFNSCFDSGKYSSAVQANFSEGSQLGVSGTPSFFIGTSNGTGQKIVGAQPYSVFKQAIDALLQ